MKRYKSFLIIIFIVAFFAAGCNVTEADKKEMVIKKFAKQNSISLSLANEIEIGLNTLYLANDDIDTFSQTEDWAYGERYKLFVDGDLYIVYASGDALVSINKDNSKVYTPKNVSSKEETKEDSSTITTYSFDNNDIDIIEIDASELVYEIINDSTGAAGKYLGKTIKVTGKIIYISDYSDLIGYYMVNDLSSGKTRIVCWFDNPKSKYSIGDTLTVVGYCRTVEESTELTGCYISK